MNVSFRAEPLCGKAGAVSGHNEATRGETDHGSRLGYNSRVEKADLRRWVEDRRAVARLERAHLADAWGPPAQAIASALSLIALEGRLRGWPPPADPVTDCEDQAMWERFARLRTRLGRR